MLFSFWILIFFYELFTPTRLTCHSHQHDIFPFLLLAWHLVMIYLSSFLYALNYWLWLFVEITQELVLRGFSIRVPFLSHSMLKERYFLVCTVRSFWFVDFLKGSSVLLSLFQFLFIPYDMFTFMLWFQLHFDYQSLINIIYLCFKSWNVSHLLLKTS